jgi:sec-independent protein translocase protein TatC
MTEKKKLTILEHLSEIRRRLIYCVIAVIITSTICFIFASNIFDILIHPAGDINLIYVEMTEMIGTYMIVCLTCGVILAMPFIIVQFLLFVSPALNRKEKKYVYIITPCIGMMFIAGVVFGYFVLIPPGLNFLTTFGSDIATPQIKIGNYVSVVSRLLLAIGFVFEMPVISTFLTRIGVLTPKWLAKKRKIWIILAFILAAIITPTFDPINQLLVAAPLIFLFELSIWLAKLVQRKTADNVVVPASSTSNVD